MALINPYIAPFRPVNNITPFTYRDGLTYLEILEGLRVYVNDELVSKINDNSDAITDAFATEVIRIVDLVEAGFATQNTNVAEQLAEQNLVNNTLVSGLASSVNAATTAANAAIAAANATIADANAAIAANEASVDEKVAEVNSAMDNLTSYVNIAISDIQNSAISITDPVIKAIILNVASETRVLLDSLYDAEAANDSVVAALVSNAVSLTNNAIEAVIDAKITTNNGAIDWDDNIFDIVNNAASATRIRLEELYNPPPRTFTNFDILNVATGQNGEIVFVIEGSVNFEYVSGVWKQINEATYANASARDTAYARASAAYRINGALAKTTDTGISRKYNSVVSPAAWEVNGPIIATVTRTTSLTLTGTTFNVIPFDAEDTDVHGLHSNTVNNSRINIPETGTYQITYHVYVGAVDGLSTAEVRLNGTTTLRSSQRRKAGTSVEGTPVSGTVISELTAGAYIELMVATTGTSKVVGAGLTDAQSIFMSLIKIS